jgi:hypothetical protein
MVKRSKNNNIELIKYIKKEDNVWKRCCLFYAWGLIWNKIEGIGFF